MGSDLPSISIEEIGFGRLENPFRPLVLGLAGIDLDSIGLSVDQSRSMRGRGHGGRVSKRGYGAEDKQGARNTKNHSIILPLPTQDHTVIFAGRLRPK